jgi:hemerythrin-like metal-binding protein
LKWIDVFETGIAELDDLHRRLVDECNELLALTASDADWSAIVAKTSELISHCIDHFRIEEAIMERIQFPRHEAHTAEHRRLEDRLRALLARVQGCDGSLAEHRDLPVSLGPLIIDVMIRHDLDYRSHLLYRQGR